MDTLIQKLILAACCLPLLAEPALADGNLTAPLVDDTLFIVGDNEINSLVVAEFEPAYFSTITCDSEDCRLIMVAGRAQNDVFNYQPWLSSSANQFLSGDSGSAVNGGDVPIFFDACQVARVVIVTGKGIDRILIRGTVTADVDMDTGNDDDRVAFSGPGGV